MRTTLIFVLTLAAAGPALAMPRTKGPDHVGRIYHYVRSNLDGSEPEAIRVFRASPTRLEVNKSVSRCTNAAYVTAELDLERGEARSLVGGRLTRAGTQQAFGWLTLEKDGPGVEGRVETDTGVLSSRVDAPDRPRVLFDFDLADLSARTQRLADPKAGFSFGLPLIWLGDDPAKFLTYLGRADATFEREESHLGRRALRFAMAGPAFGGKPGVLWLDADQGFVVGAEWPMPNHAEYRDFKLALQRVDEGGEPAWTAVLADHWKGCAPR